MKKVVVGILAHVDAGKTTLSEALLFESGMIKKYGRVDHKDTYLDTYSLERERGITIFSKLARIVNEKMEITLVDTPGHIDFSAEMERSLAILDYAILIINASSGIQSHTETLWKLLQLYKIPTFIFINKMDLCEKSEESLLIDLQKLTKVECINFDKASNIDWEEQVAMCEESVMESYLNGQNLTDMQVSQMIKKGYLIPCIFGSALKFSNTKILLEYCNQYMVKEQSKEDFGAYVYKITRDDQGNRLTFLKVTGGELKAKMMLKEYDEKIHQIRLYSGAKYEAISSATAGMVVAITGISKSQSGDCLGAERRQSKAYLEPILKYQMVLPKECDPVSFYQKLLSLQEEIPELNLSYLTSSNCIEVSLMGEIQTEILKQMIREKYDVEISFDVGHVVYKETLTEPVVGVGHFEPLRHYAEVQLYMEPLSPGSGMKIESFLSEDKLDKNWQKLIATHLKEITHKGVLIGAPITDVKITIVNGKAHPKHTEGGDFREATYRAVRHGLKSAKCKLLEPYYEVKATLPVNTIGRFMNDMEQRKGKFEAPLMQGEFAVIEATVSVAAFADYSSTFYAYTKGRGKISVTCIGYLDCINEDEIIEGYAYDSEADLDYPTGSIFCKQGTGYFVPWNEVKQNMHLPDFIDGVNKQNRSAYDDYVGLPNKKKDSGYHEKELEAIMKREFGDRKTKVFAQSSTINSKSSKSTEKEVEYKYHPPMEEYLLVDGYNIIFSWEELRLLSETNLEAARGKLMDILCDYQGFTKCHLILVYDAYKVKGNQREIMRYHNIDVIYTKEAETADMYIEKTTKTLCRNNRVRVATSDALEQTIILGNGALRVSANEFYEEIVRTKEQMNRYLK